jgi:hypothetical protein
MKQRGFPIPDRGLFFRRLPQREKLTLPVIREATVQTPLFATMAAPSTPPPVASDDHHLRSKPDRAPPDPLTLKLQSTVTVAMPTGSLAVTG